MWNLGQFTYENYVKSGFLPSTYTKMHSQVFAAGGYRTLISASAWAQVAFPESYANGPNIPAAVFSVPEDQDDLLEVRHATCANRLAVDLNRFDHTTAKQMIHDNKAIIEKISAACGFDLRHAPAVTDGEFSVMQAVKDVADALTGDMLEGLPLISGITPEDRDEFIQLAEHIFHARHYGAHPAMPAYNSGNFPMKMLKTFDRRISYNANVTALEQFPDTPFAKQLAEEAEESILAIVPPRRMFGFHAHRELLYAMTKLLKLDFTVERPGVQKGLVHPSTGVFFELWRDKKRADELTGKALKAGELPTLSAERSRRRRYDSGIVDEAYYVRALVWVPCWDEKGATVPFLGRDQTPFCPARVRMLEQCGQEFCPLPQFRSIIQENLKAVGGDFKALCAEDVVAELQRELDVILAAEAAELANANATEVATPKTVTAKVGEEKPKKKRFSKNRRSRGRNHGKNHGKDAHRSSGKGKKSHVSGALQYLQYVEDNNNWARVAASHNMN